MSKKLIALFAVLVLMLSLIPAACADDTEYIYVDAGESIYQPVVEIESSTGYSCDLPTGLYVEEDGHAGHKHLILCGSISRAGTYDAKIYIDDMGTWAFKIVVQGIQPVLPPPYISFQSRGQECGVGDNCNIYVEVANPGGYTLYYSWYRDGAWYCDGSPSVYADTSRTGTSYYTCDVGYYVNGDYCCVTSNSIGVKVKAPHVIDYIYIHTNPYKNMYSVGDYLNTEGLVVGLTYKDGDEQTVQSGFTCDPTYMDRVGTKTINVYYNGYYTSFNVSVREKVVISDVSVYKLPEKLNYNIGESLDTTGMSLRVNYSDGDSSIYDNGFTCSPTSFQTEGSQTVTVTYEGKTTSFNVNVQDPTKTTGITIDSLPTKLEYNVGDQLDVSGLRIKVSSKGGSEVVEALNNSKFSYAPVILNTEGQQLVTVTYKDGRDQYDCQFNVQVKKSSKAPDNPAPSAPVEPTAADSGTNTLLIILCAALAVVLILFICVIVMMIRNRRELENMKFSEKMSAEREWRKNRKHNDSDE